MRMYSLVMGSAVRAISSDVAAPASLESVYDQSAEQVWLMLQRMGVRDADLEDVCHDVFLVAHRRFADFDGRVRINAWLFGICLRVAANYRRRARFRYERPMGAMNDECSAIFAPASTRPDHQLARREEQALAQAILDGMDLTKRAVFLMFEIEGLSCQEIADQLGVPIGTVYSRLHAARAVFEREAKRLTAASDEAKDA
jgi:RNA polymerase sigma-70 factor, ECF subfamily